MDDCFKINVDAGDYILYPFFYYTVFRGNCGINYIYGIGCQASDKQGKGTSMAAVEEVSTNEKELLMHLADAMDEVLFEDGQTPLWMMTDCDPNYLDEDTEDRSDYFENPHLRILYEDHGIDLSLYRLARYMGATKADTFYNDKSGRYVSIWTLRNPYCEHEL